MLRTLVTAVSALAIASVSGSACAMKTSSSQPLCRVVGGSKLPAGSGGEQGVCAAVEQAVAAEAPRTRASIEVRVLSASSLAATITTADGRTLPEQRMAIMDRTLNEASIQRFARTIAAELAKAGGR